MTKNRMIKAVVIIILGLFAASVLSCGGGGSSLNSGTTKVTVNIGQSKLASFFQKLLTQSSSAIPSNVASIRIVISGDGTTFFDKTIDVSGQTEISESFEVPNGANRHFLATASSSDGTVLFQGDAFADLDGTPEDIAIQMGFDIAGDWTFTVNGSALLFDFHQVGNSLTFTATTLDGGSTAAANSHAAALPGSFAGTCTIVGNNLQCTAEDGIECGNPIIISIVGTVSADGSSIAGTFTQSGGCLTSPETFSLSAVEGIVPPGVNVSGAWSLFHTQQTPQVHPEEGPDFFNVTQNGNSVIFTSIRDDGSQETINGTIDGNNILLSFAETDQCSNPVTITLTGTISQDGSSMTGTYSRPGTSGNCAAGETGTWRTTKAQPPAFDISGPWSGFRTPLGLSEQGPACVTFAQTGSYLAFAGDTGGILGAVGSGILSGNNIQLQFSELIGGDGIPGCKITNHLTGTIAPDGNSVVNGTYTTTNDCGLPAVGGIWRAEKGTCTTPPTGQGSISGTVKNAVDGLALSGVTIKLLLGGTTIGTTASNSAGIYSFTNVPAGSGYSLEFVKDGYTTVVKDNITVNANAVTQVPDVVLSTVLQAGQTRIVLTWGASPSDLDSHLTGPIPDSTARFHVFYADQGSETSLPFATLDLDDTSSFGPETTSIFQQFSGVYKFYVHDFDETGLLPNSGAQVQVFQGNSLVATFNVPNQAGTVWTVFQLDGATITPINTMSSDTSVIQSASRTAASLKKAKKKK